MMILRSAAPSPFGRKVQIALSVLGFDDVKVEPTDTMDPHDPVRAQNPLGKIPVLIGEDGIAYYDSRVILEYLDERAAAARSFRANLVSVSPRSDCRRLCDGLIDASILTVYEGRWRAPERHEPKWLDHQAGKVNACDCFT